MYMDNCMARESESEMEFGKVVENLVAHQSQLGQHAALRHKCCSLYRKMFSGKLKT
jgi:hypothetical protein